MKRRDFLKSSLIGGGVAVTLTGCGAKGDKLIPLLIPEDRFLPGIDMWTPSTCALCPAGCSILVRSMMGEANAIHKGKEARQAVLQVKKIEGNLKSPINQGRICARGQAGLQMLYNPDRIRTPLIRSGPRGSGKFQRISWDEALVTLGEKLNPLGSTATTGTLAALCGITSSRRRQLIREFIAAAGSKHCYFEEPPGVPTLREANRRMFGLSQLESHDLENARYLISFGADLLETHTSPVRYTLGFAHSRQGRPGERCKFVQVQSRFSLTAANADEWLPAKPGTAGAVALAMAHVIIEEDLIDKGALASRAHGFQPFCSWVLKNYPPEKIASEAGLPSKQIIRVAREFARHRPAIALAGGSALAHPDGVFTALAVQSLNVLVGSIGNAGGVFWASDPAHSHQDRAAPRDWVNDFRASADSISALILCDADPVYASPGLRYDRSSLEKIPFIAAFSAFKDDSNAYADLVLPDQTYLERWDLIEPEVSVGPRILSVAQPIIRPMYESRDSADILLGLAARWGGKSREALPDDSFSDYLRRTLAHDGVLNRGSFAVEDLDDFWSNLLEQGVWSDKVSRPTAPSVDLSPIQISSGQSGTPIDSANYPFYLEPFETISLGMGKTANIPWLQELPDPMTSIVWGSWVEINPRTASRLGIHDNEWVWIESSVGKIKIPALICPASPPDTVSILLGQGHRSYGRYASGRGVNPWEVITPVQVRDAGEPARGATRVRIVRTGEKAALVRLGHDSERSPAELGR